MNCTTVFVKGYSVSVRMHVATFSLQCPPYCQRITPNHSSINRLLDETIIPLAASPETGLAETDNATFHDNRFLVRRL